jgi:23S rRNA (cytosine1962-C5)-methyltransferase
LYIFIFMQPVVLKPGKEKPIKNFHHWIFSGAILRMPAFADGDILPVESADGEFLGFAYFNSRTSIAGRMLSFDRTPAEDAVKRRIDQAIALRQTLFDPSVTTAYRLVNSEGDGIPGLVIDMYGGAAVMQITTRGIDRLKPLIVEHLRTALPLKTIYEKSNVPSRGEEGLKDAEGLLWGEDADEVEVRENGIAFIVSIKGGQKSGFFLDQREMRRWAGELSGGKRVLNCFGYTGGFSLYAITGGAARVDTVDISEEAIALARRNAALNEFPADRHGWLARDVFEFLREDALAYDVIILDPPAFAKRKIDVVRACRGYKDINRLAIQKIPSGGIVMTSSCSYHVDEKLFQTVVFQAAREAGRTVRIIGRHRLAPDHPINIFHPEGEYLKSLLLFVE